MEDVSRARQEQMVMRTATGGNTSVAKRFTLFDPEVFSIFVRADEIVEVRSINGRNVTAGYFDDHDAFCSAVRRSERTGGNVYYTLQVIDPRLLGRSLNRMKPGIATTSDNNVLAYRWLPIDIDPVRPSGVASSGSELQDAYNLREQVVDWIQTNLGFENPVKAMSGNGYHALYRLPDLEVNESNRQFIRSMLDALDQNLSTPKVSIDTKVFNPARIWKLYGTTARKGDAVPANQYREARPHRASYIESLGDCR